MDISKPEAEQPVGVGVLAEAAWRVGWRGHCCAVPVRSGVCGDSCGSRLRDACAGVEIDVILTTGGTVPFARVFIA